MSWVCKIKEAINYIEENLFDAISIETVAEAINYAPSSFQNLFSAITGYSIGEYIRFRRLSDALDELLENKVTVTDMAFKCGYDNVESFSRAFRRLFGTNPSSISTSNLVHHKFNPIQIDIKLNGGFNMTRNVIPNLMKVDWSDTSRQNEFVNSVVSALNALGENLTYDYVCAISGSAFRTSFSVPSTMDWNHGNYHVINAPIIIGHTFKMLGYKISHRIRDDYEADKKVIKESIDKGIPVISLEGVINCSDACVISGYDNNCNVLLGYSPFMYMEEDHNEAHDDTGYFRKSNWYDGFCAEGSKVRFLIIEDKCDKPTKEEAFAETLKIIKRLIVDEKITEGQYNGLSAHKAFLNALLNYEWNDNFEPYLNSMCNEKQYLDRQYAIEFFYDNNRSDLAKIYEQIADLSIKLINEIPQDFSAGEKFSNKEKLKPFCDILLKISELENQVVNLI